MTRTPLSRSKGQGHQAALLTAALKRQAAAVVSVGTYRAWGNYSYVAVCSAALGALAPTEGGEGWGHIVVAACQQLVNKETVYTAFSSSNNYNLRMGGTTYYNLTDDTHACMHAASY